MKVGDVDIDSYASVPAEELEEGMLVDLMGDKVADPGSHEQDYAFEYAEVMTVDVAGALVDVEFNYVVVTFPRGHFVKVVQQLPNLEEAVAGLQGIVEDLQ